MELFCYSGHGSLVFTQELINPRVRVLLGNVSGLLQGLNFQSGQREEEIA